MKGNFFDDIDLNDIVSTNAAQTGAKVVDKKISDMTAEELKDFQNSTDFKKFSADKIKNAEILKNQGDIGSVSSVLGLSMNKYNYQGYSHTIIETESFEDETYEDIFNRSPSLIALFNEGESVLPTFKYLLQDLFFSLYKYNVRVKNTAQIHLSSKMNYTLLDSVVNTPAYITLRRTCRSDMFNSVMGSKLLGEQLLIALKDSLKRVNDLKQNLKNMDDLLAEENRLDDIQDKIKDLDTLLAENQDLLNNGLPGMGQDELNGYVKMRDDSIIDAETARDLARQQNRLCDDLLDNDELDDDLQASVENELNAIDFEIQKCQEDISAFGVGDSGAEDSYISFENKKRVIEAIRNSKKVKEYVKNLGRFKECAKEVQKKKSKTGSTEISSVTKGGDINSVLPSEMIGLCRPEMKLDFYKRLNEKSLLQYQKTAQKDKNQGPIIVCMDTSGSINSSQDVWEKSIAGVMLEIAQTNKRDFAYIIYDSSANAPVIIKKNEICPDKIIKMVETYKGGGTNFEAPLKAATELMKQAAFRSGDIVFITDGESEVSDAYLRTYKAIKEDKEFLCHGIILNTGRNSRSHKKSLERFCDDVLEVSKLTELEDPNSETNKEIFGKV